MFSWLRLCAVPVVCILSAASALAAAPMKLHMDSIVAQVPPGTRIKIEMRAQYLVVDPHGEGAKAGQPAEVFRIASTGALKWEFTVKADGTAKPATADFRFPKPLLKAPTGMTAILQFPTSYSIECPASAPNCGSRTREVAFGMPIRKDITATSSVCLQFRGGPNGVFIGIADDCADPRTSGKFSTKPVQ
jgi:hypothetical protein